MSLRRAKVTVSDEEAEQRLDHWLAERFTYHTRSQWQRAIRSGRLTVNEREVKPAYTVQGGDRVEYFLPRVAEPPVDSDFEILSEEPSLLVINKPGNLPCHPSGKYFRHTLWHLLRAEYGDVHPVNRLDRETSGLVLVARSSEAAAALGRQFAERRVRKEYLVLVEGAFPGEVSAVGTLGPDRDSDVKKKQRFTVTDPAESNCRTDFICLEQADGLSLLRCLPQTGRLHQLRATLFGLGFPLVGDKLYGYDDHCFLDFIDDRLSERQWERLGMARQALHAARLDVAHPLTGERLTLHAPLPADFRQCLLTHGFGGRYS